MPLKTIGMRQCRHAFAVAVAAAIAVGLSGCAEEPPAERYTQTVEEQGSQEPVSLKDTWDKGTTVYRASLPPPQVVYSFPPANSPVTIVEPARPRVATPAPPPAPKQRPATPNLAISAPPAVPAAPPKALTESDLQQDTMRCGVGIDCLAVLRAMIADPKQSWMMRTPTPAEFANGTRLFAYRALRKTIDCGKLRFAGAELEWAMDTFSRDVQGMDAAHRARVSALAADVRSELEDEVHQRC